jgi:uncharacterized repeat protein (TIGR03803 family)
MFFFRKNYLWISGALLPLFLAVQSHASGSITNVMVLRSFSTNDASADPFAPLIEGSDGMLYGTTYGGHGLDLGGVFKIGKDGNNFQVIHSFTFDQGDTPSAAVMEATNGVLYGTTWVDTTTGGGSIFKLNKDGGGFAVLHVFTYATNDGGNSTAPLMQASDGKLYGTAQAGGNNNGNDGVVFRIDLSGSNFMVLHAFTNGDGLYPQAGLIEGTNGMLYGTAIDGGGANGGTVFRMSKDGGSFSVIFNFTNTPDAPDGFSPASSLLMGPNGLLYGTTLSGGIHNKGIAFSMDYNGNNFAILHNFGGATDGNGAYEPLILGPDGAVYGSTEFSGSITGAGTVFSMNADGSGYNQIVVVTNAIGNQPVGVTAASDGAIYVPCNGGGSDNRGSILKLTAIGIIDNDVLNPPLAIVGGWRVSGHGTANRAYTVLASTNIALPASNWTSLGTATSDVAGAWQFDELTNVPIRFYRTSYP